MSAELITAQVKQWVETVIVAYNFCPFAKREVDRDTVRYQVIDDNFSGQQALETSLHQLIEECQQLDQQPEIETTLLIFSQSFADFEDFLDLLEIANVLLEEQGYLGTYQLASFHPDYCFADVEPDDSANYTNRAPYPILHLIREASIEQALKSYDNPEQIPERNIALARELGAETWRGLLTACLLQR